MARITNSDQIMLLLRHHLERQARTRKTEVVPSSPASKPQAEPSAIKRAKALLNDGTMDEDQMAEVFIGGILRDEFGPRLASDPQFSSLVKDVTRSILDMEGGRELLSRAAEQLSSD